MQVQTKFATDDIDGGGTTIGMMSPQDMVVESRVVVAGRSGVGRGEEGALSVDHIGVKGASVHRGQQGAFSSTPRTVSSWHWTRRAAGVLCLSPQHQSD